MRLAKPRRVNYNRKELLSSPTFERDRARHAPEAGLGGSYFMVSYRGQHLGAIFSTWDAEHDVHWRVAHIDGDPYGVDGKPLTFETREAATNWLLDLKGIDGTVEYDKAPHGRGKGWTDLRY